MAWYAAHCVLKVEPSGLDGTRAYENVYLIEAGSTDEAEAKARDTARLDEAGTASGFEVDGRAARLVFAGIRRLVSVRRASDHMVVAPQLADDLPEDRAELTYSRFRFGSDDELAKFLSGRPVDARILE